MTLQDEIVIDRPYCGESLWILVDPSIEFQEYVEDCQVCCQPIEIVAVCEPGLSPAVKARHQDEV